MSNNSSHSRMAITLPGVSKNDVFVESISGVEKIGAGYQFVIGLLTKETLKLADMLGKATTFELEVGDEKSKIHGVVAKAETRNPTPKREFCYQITLEPELSMLRYSAQNQVYGTNKDVTVVDILDAEMSDANKSNSKTSPNRVARNIKHDMLASAGDYPKLDFVMQYRESDFNFISRMCERFGIFFLFDHSGDKEKVVFGDRKEHFTKLVGPDDDEKLPYRSKQQVRGSGDFAIWSFNSAYTAASGSVELREYNEDTPKVSLSVAENASYEGQGVVTLYDENYPTESEGRFIAKRRVEQLEGQRLQFTGEGNIPQLRPGKFFKLTDHPLSELDGLYIVIEVEHNCVQTTPLGFSSADKSPQPYFNKFVCVPFDKGYRPPVVTPKPVVHGYLNAVIDGETKGQRAELDDAGRYRIRILDEESDLKSGKASYAVRKLEPYGGGDGFGSHFSLLIGTEVLLGFRHGDPDRPIILGAVSNGEQTNPVTSSNQNVAYRVRTASGIVMQISDGAA